MAKRFFKLHGTSTALGTATRDVYADSVQVVDGHLVFTELKTRADNTSYDHIVLMVNRDDFYRVEEQPYERS